jgi:hypothetical protein
MIELWACRKSDYQKETKMLEVNQLNSREEFIRRVAKAVTDAQNDSEMLLITKTQSDCCILGKGE